MRLVLLLLAATLGVSSSAQASARSAELTARAVDAADRGDRASARTLLDEAVSADPADPEAWYHLGRLALHAKEYASAVTALEKAQAAGYPDSFALGVAYRAAKRPADAESALRQSIAYQPRNLEARYFLGLVLIEAGRHAEAKEHLEAAKANAGLRAKVEAREGAGASTAKSWFLSVDLLHQTDSNVILAQTDTQTAESVFSADEITNKSGNRVAAVLGGGVRFNPAARNQLTAAYNGYHSYHWSSRETLSNYDVSSHGLSIRDDHRFGSLSAGIGLSGGATLLGLEGYSTRAGAAPRLTYALTKKQALGLEYALGLETFTDKGGPVTVAGKTLSTDRSNTTHEADVTYALRFGKRGYLTPSAGYLLSDAKGTSVWDYSGLRARVSALAPLGEAFGVAAGAGLVTRTFAHDTIVPAGAGLAFESREDTEISADAALRYDWSRYRAQAGASFTRSASTVDLYDYSRTIFSLGFGASL